MPVSDEFFLRRRAGWSPATASSDFTTSFSVTENPISQGSKWLNGADDGANWLNFKTLSGVACAGANSSTTPPPFNDSICQLKSSVIALPADHYVEAVVFRQVGYSPGNTHELGLFVRMSITNGVARGYEAYVNHSNNHTIVRWNGALNDFTSLAPAGTPTVPVTGDVYRMEAQGSTIRFLQNGTLVSSVTDSTWTNGQTGMQSYLIAGGTAENYGFTSFKTGPL